MDYCILKAFKAEDLEEKVREAMSEGWMPLGGVTMAMAVYHDRKDHLIYQAMTKG